MFSNNNFNGQALGNIFNMAANAKLNPSQNAGVIMDNFKNAIMNMSENKLHELKLQAKRLGIADSQISQGMDFINSIRSNNK